MEHSSASRVVKAAAFSRNRGMSRMKSGFFLVTHMRLSSKEQKFLQKISLSEPKPIRFQTQKDFSCYFFDLSFSLLLDA